MTYQRVSSPKTFLQSFANVSDRQKPFREDSSKIRQNFSSPKTMRERFANVLVRQKPFGKDSPTCQFARN